MLLPGNCLIGAVILWFLKGGTIKKVWGSQSWLPHFVLRTKSGKTWHFSSKIEFLPDPFGMLFYLGRFEPFKK